MRRRGAILFEMLIGSLIALLIGAGLFQLMKASYSSEAQIGSTNNAITNARVPVDLMADHIRGAQECDSDGYAVIKEGQTSDLTYYADNAGDEVRYRLNNGSIVRTDSSGTSTVATGVTNLTFTYYKVGSYNDTAGITATTDSHHPTDAERPYLAIVEIQATITVGGVPRSYTTRVRLRNSPRKTTL